MSMIPCICGLREIAKMEGANYISFVITAVNHEGVLYESFSDSEVSVHDARAGGTRAKIR